LVDKDNMITHKVKDPTRKDHYFYLTQKQAREYFALLADPTKKEFVIADTEKFIYITIPRNKFYLIWLDDESDIEDILMRS
jgi:hypothetical protein